MSKPQAMDVEKVETEEIGTVTLEFSDGVNYYVIPLYDSRLPNPFQPFLDNKDIIPNRKDLVFYFVGGNNIICMNPEKKTGEPRTLQVGRFNVHYLVSQFEDDPEDVGYDE